MKPETVKVELRRTNEILVQVTNVGTVHIGLTIEATQELMEKLPAVLLAAITMREDQRSKSGK